MSDALNFVFQCIHAGYEFLTSWSFLGVPFLYYLMGLALIGILIDFIFG